MEYSNRLPTVYKPIRCIEPIFVASCLHYINTSLQRIAFSIYTILHIYFYTYNTFLFI